MIDNQKEWTYNHRDWDWPIVNVFLEDDVELRNHVALQNKLHDMQNIECSNHLKGSFINLYALHDIQWIDLSLKQGYKYAAIWFEGTWPNNVNYNKEILENIDQLGDNWLLAGEVLKGNILSKSLMILNLTKWKSLNLNLTPIKIPRPQDHKLNLYGIRWMKYSVAQDIPIKYLSGKVWNTVTATKPSHYDLAEFQKGIQGELADNTKIGPTARRLVDQVKNASQTPIYFVNTETTIPGKHSSNLQFNFQQYAGPSGGFKLLNYAYKYGRTYDTSFVWYDFDPASCQFKQDLLDTWDGVDYVDWVENWCKNNKKIGNHSLLDRVNDGWIQTLKSFNGLENFIDYWDQAKTNSQVIEIDLIGNSEFLFNNLERTPTFFWSSNIFSYNLTRLLSNQFETEESFIKLIKQLKKLNCDSWFCGTDLSNTEIIAPVTGIFSTRNNKGIGNISYYVK